MEELILKRVNFELATNCLRHETEGLSSKHLVVRRGEPFRITLFFHGRPFNPYRDSLVFRAALGELYVQVPATFSKPRSYSEWNAEIEPVTGAHSQTVTVSIFPPAFSPVGLYELKLQVLAMPWQYNYRLGQFVLLYNPWCPADAVYLNTEDMREEWLRNDFGFLYVGTSKNVVPRPWEFGQYEEGILDICLDLLNVSPQHMQNWETDYLRRSDPVYLSRVVCAMINCEDDRGILKGNWSGDFKNGVNPSEWTGSAEILTKWAQSGFSPVHYGQCWVFAAVMCTVMRALGIPCRVVTNFNSAHDTNGNLVIEEYYDEMGKKLHMSRDSIWNFHVWVECWMTRRDLGSGYDGWQVLDPTPQERSNGVFCCGPSPVKAIQERQLDMKYDVPFVFAEVNADVHTVIVNGGQVLSRSVDKERVGSVICTKSLGSSWPLNVTSSYKNNKAETPNGRLMTADTRSLRRSQSFQGGKQSLAISLNLDKTPVAGEAISFTVSVTNKENSPRTLREHVNAQAKEYNSSPRETFWEIHNILHLGPHEAKSLVHQITHSEYEEMLLGDGLVNLAVVMQDVATHERVLATEEFNIANPQISILVMGDDYITKNEKCEARITFRNTFHVPVRGVLTVMGAGLLSRALQSNINLPPGETMEEMISFTPMATGTKMLHAKLLMQHNPTVINGFTTVLVRPGA